MLTNLKGMGTGTIMKLTLALMTAGLFISVGTIGSIGSSLEEGFGMIGENTDFTIKLEDKDEGKQKLSNASLYVRQRAGNKGCKDNNGESWNSVHQQITNENGYPALEGTYIGKEPSCEGASSGALRGAQGAAQELGQDQEGVFSRVAFRANTKIELDTGSPDTWLEHRMRGAAKGSLEQNTLETCSEDTLDSVVSAGATGAVLGAAGGSVGGPVGATIGAIGGAAMGISGAAIGEAVNQEFVGTGDRFVVFLQPNDMDSRVNGWLNDASDFQFGERLYCYGLGEKVSNGDLSELELSKSPLNDAYDDHYGGDFELTLCPGDEGYIQMNKGKPQNDGEAGAQFTGNAKNFPHIVITEKGEDCT